MKVQGGKAVPVHTNNTVFMEASRDARQKLLATFNAFVKMVSVAPEDVRNSKDFKQIDEALNSIDRALKGLEYKASQTTNHWTGK